MNKKTIIFQTLVFFISTIFSACTSNKNTLEKDVAFRMSDTMIKKCPIETVQKSPVLSEMRLFGKIEPDNNKMAQVYSVLGGSVRPSFAAKR